MSRPVLTAVTDRWEGRLVTVLERATDLDVARRCADLPELLAAAAAGLAAVALVSADLRSLDRAALAHLRDSGVAVVGVYPPGDEAAERQPAPARGGGRRRRGRRRDPAAGHGRLPHRARRRVPGSDPAGRATAVRPGLQGVPPQLTRSRACWSTRHGRVPERVPARASGGGGWAPATPTTRAS